MDLARAPRRAPLTARKKGSGYENGIDMSCSLVPYSKGRREIERCVALISPYFSDQWEKNMVCFIPYRSVDNTVHSPILICTDIRHKVSRVVMIYPLFSCTGIYIG